jgi:hypothetical protein
MSVRTAEERADMVEELLPQAANLVALVHGDGGPRDIHQALARLDATQKEALLVILAALVDPDRPMSRALAWVDFDEYGRTVVPPAWSQHGTIRDLAPEPELEDDETFVDEAAVEAYALGKPVTVTNRERVLAIAAAVGRGVSYLELDALHGLKKNNTATFVSRQRRYYKDRGEEFPIPERPGMGSAHLTDEQVVAIRERYAEGGITDMDLAVRYGVTRNSISRVLTGVSYPQAGGPIRPKKGNRPGEATRTIWGGGRPGYGCDSETKEKVA